MYEVIETQLFSKWLIKLKDIKAKVAILRRIERISHGLFGDSKSVGENISELRVDISGGYRVYYTIQNNKIIILLIGGNKSTQQKDIIKAKEIAREIK